MMYPNSISSHPGANLVPMPSHILKSNNLKQLADDIYFFQSLESDSELDCQIYFDTAGVIDMLLGMSGLFNGVQINWNNYNRSSTLVYALGYRNWLGKIYTLPPHTEEFIEKIQVDKRLFKDHFSDIEQELEDEFWATIRQEFGELKEVLENEEAFKAYIPKLKANSVDLFKGVYLGKEKNFWKYRYKYLVRDKNILQFSAESDYRLGEVRDSKLFTPLLKYLNEKRQKSSNNYMDAIALCLLDAKLQRFNDGHEEQEDLPIFFSDQEHILDAVRFFSQEEFDDRRPFVFTAKGQEFLIVRDANFFIIKGIFRALKDRPSSSKDLIQDLFTALGQFIQSAENSRFPFHGESIQLPFEERINRKVRAGLEKRSEEKVFLEFFNQWWHDGGYEELKRVVAETLLDPKRQVINKDINDYIDQERKKLKVTFIDYSGRISLIKKAWNQFHNLKDLITTKFSSQGERINIHKEFGSRFSYPDKLCDEIQELCDRIFRAVNIKDDQELHIAEADVITDLISGLFEKGRTKEEENLRLNQLAKSLAILWLFKMYDLIDDACTIVRKQWENDPNVKNGDKYPSSPIALLHAASIFQGRSQNEEQGLQIIHCVENKYGQDNYKVWVGLSFLYYLLWDRNIDYFEFPEIRFEESSPDNKVLERNRKHLEKAINYSYKAIEWLENSRLDIEEKEKQEYRQRNYYYALNNYLFFKTMLATPEEFLKLEPKARKLEYSARRMEYWHADRFADTLARFFFRKAILSDSPEEFKDCIKHAIDYNNDAIENSEQDKLIYRILSRNLKATKRKGYPFAKGLREGSVEMF